MNYRKLAVHNFIWIFTSSTLSKILHFITYILLARLLNPKDFGIVSLTAVFVDLADTIKDAGIGQSLIRKREATYDDFNSIFFYNLFVGLILYSSIFLLAPYIEKFYELDDFAEVIRVLGVTLILNSFGYISRLKMTKDLEFKKQFKIGIPSLITSSILGITLAFLNFGYWSLVFMRLFKDLMNVILYNYNYTWRPSSQINLKILKEHIIFGSKLLISAMVNHLFTNLYVFVISKVYNTAILGLFNNADNFRKLFTNQIMVSMNQLTLPLFSKIDNNLELKNIYRKLTIISFTLICPLMFFFSINSDYLYLILFGEKWMFSSIIFKILIFAELFRILTSYGINLMIVKNHADLVLKITIFRRLFFVIILFMTIYWGVIQLAWGIVISEILSYFTISYYYNKLINYTFKELIQDYSPIILISIIAFFFTYAANKIPGIELMDKYAILILNGIIFITIYLVLLILFLHEVWEWLKNIKNDLVDIKKYK